MIKVKIILFGYFKTALNVEEVTLTLPPNINVGEAYKAFQCFSFQENSQPMVREISKPLFNMPVTFALNHRLVDEEEKITNGDTLFILPPVGGG